MTPTVDGAAWIDVPPAGDLPTQVVDEIGDVWERIGSYSGSPAFLQVTKLAPSRTAGQSPEDTTWGSRSLEGATPARRSHRKRGPAANPAIVDLWVDGQEVAVIALQLDDGR